MRNIVLVLSGILAIVFDCAAQNSQEYKIAFYNVENLFDTIDDPKVIDEEFLPSSKMAWNSVRYQEKLDKISKVLDSIGAGELPVIAGFCEIENKSVLEDLITKTPLSKGNYEIVHEDSPDARGIDVGLIYRKDFFTYLSQEAIAVNFENDTTKTRDILYVKGLTGKKDTLHCFVNHWPSRRGGEQESESKRLTAAKTLKMYTDAILNGNKNAKIIIMGDFNDGPLNKSIKEVLNASVTQPTKERNSLYHMLYNKAVNSGEGSHYYDGHYMMLDQIIVSHGLINAKKGILAGYDNAYVFRADWLMFTDKKTGDKRPNRTYVGPRYVGGYSDHLPVYLKIEKKK